MSESPTHFRACVCVRACVRACVCARVCVYVCVRCALVCLLRYRLTCVNANLRISSCHGKLHGHNRGRCELQNGAKFILLGGHLRHFGNIFGCSGRSLEVSGQCFWPSQQKLRCGGQFWCEFSQICNIFGGQNDAKSQS